MLNSEPFLTCLKWYICNITTAHERCSKICNCIQKMERTLEFNSWVDFRVQLISKYGEQEWEIYIFCRQSYKFPPRPRHTVYEDPLYDQYDSTSLRAEGWIRHLVENNIVRLDTSIYATIQLPRSLFTCVSLAELRLNLFFKDLPLPGYAFLPNLRVVYLEQTRFHASTQFERLIKGCPALEDLHMKGCAFFGPDFKWNNFSHPKIKSLNIERCGGFEALKVYIWMPNLLEFRFKGIGLVDQRGLIDLSSLSTAVLELKEILYT